MLVLGRRAGARARRIGGEVLALHLWRGVFVVLAVLGLMLVVVAASASPRRCPASAAAPARRAQHPGDLPRPAARPDVRRPRPGRRAGDGGAVRLRRGRSFVFQDGFGLDAAFGLVFGLAGRPDRSPAAQRGAAAPVQPRVLARPSSLGAAPRPTLLVVGLTGPAAWRRAGAAVVLFARSAWRMPNAPALALARHGEAAGTAAALLGAVQIGVGAWWRRWSAPSAAHAVPMGAVMTGARWSRSPWCSRPASGTARPSPSRRPCRPDPQRPSRWRRGRASTSTSTASWGSPTSRRSCRTRGRSS